jgi:hypothetical protein
MSSVNQELANQGNTSNTHDYENPKAIPFNWSASKTDQQDSLQIISVQRWIESLTDCND